MFAIYFTIMILQSKTLIFHFEKSSWRLKLWKSSNNNQNLKSFFFRFWRSWNFKTMTAFLKKKTFTTSNKFIRRKTFDSLNLIQYFFNALNDDNWFHKMQIDSHNKKINHLFFMKKNIIEILKNNFEILLMNCIYKINKYKMFFLIIVKHIFLNIIFYVKFVFLINEKEKIFVWILYTLHNYFTISKIFYFDVMMIDRDLILIKILTMIFFMIILLLCVWHVNKNILTHCKSSFEIKKTWNKFYIVWQIVIYVFTFEIFAIAWIKIQNNYYTKHFDFIKYLKITWIKIFVKRLIWFHINKIHQFFTIIISR